MLKLRLLHTLIIVLTLFIMAGVVYLRHSPKPALSSFYSNSTAIYARHGELLRLTLAKDAQYRIWTPLSEIPKNIQTATLLYEDRWFYQHLGVNPFALSRSVWMTYGKESRQGASTITMQVARQVFNINSRTISGKLWQIGAAFWLELRYSKAELLEAYLNIAPYSGNISGVSAASLIFFHKPVSQLNVAEALTLAVIPQNPVRRAP
ncbi:partial Penicillin-binding protein 1C, partial [Patescibacteria group bacterium]